MRLTGTEDLRVQKTVGAIQETFKQLLLERPYEKITVPLTLYRRWVADGKPVASERLADVACALVLDGMRGLTRGGAR